MSIAVRLKDRWVLGCGAAGSSLRTGTGPRVLGLRPMLGRLICEADGIDTCDPADEGFFIVAGTAPRNFGAVGSAFLTARGSRRSRASRSSRTRRMSLNESSSANESNE